MIVKSTYQNLACVRLYAFTAMTRHAAVFPFFSSIQIPSGRSLRIYDVRELVLAVAVSDIGALHRKDRSLSACPGLPHSPPSRSAVQFERVCPQCGRESVAPWRRGRFTTLQHSGEFLDLVAEEEAAEERQREREREESRKRDHPPGPFSHPTKLRFFSSPPGEVTG